MSRPGPGSLYFAPETGMHADRIGFIARRIMETFPEYAEMLDRIATDVRRLECSLDEIAADARDDELLRHQAGGNVVRFDRRAL